MLNEYQLAAAKLLLRAMSRRPDEPKSSSILRLYLPREIIREIRTREAEHRAYNRDAAGDTAGLSADAAEYWSDCKKMLRYGRLHHALHRTSRREKALSRMCERLEESFEARVSASDKGKFLVYQVDGTVWDDRWHACVDWFPPILRAELASGQQIENPRARAQFDVLSELLAPAQQIPPPVSHRLRALARGKHAPSSLAMTRMKRQDGEI